MWWKSTRRQRRPFEAVGKSLDVGSGVAATIRDVVESLARSVGTQVEPRFRVVEDMPLEEAPDGKIVAAGYTTAGGDFALARYNRDGSLDTSFDGDGQGHH
jgi:hypothetical protein